MTDAQDGDMMSLLDTSMFNPFDPLAMNLDGPDDGSLTHAFQSVSATRPTTATGVESSLIQTDNTPFGSSIGDESNTAASGAGPLPVGFPSQQSSISGSSTLTEFTKRRNWPAKVVEELQDLLQILDTNGRIKYASPSITALTGYAPDDVQDQFLKDLVHPDDVGVFVAELNESTASGTPLRMFYRLKKKDGTFAIFESIGHAHIAAAKFAPNPHNQSPFCQAVFMMSRPYPTKNANLLDSFLEHKIENERLRRRIAELRREEEAEEDAQKQWLQSQEGRSEIAPSEDTMITSSTGQTATYPGSNIDTTMPPPPTQLNAALTRENLEGVAAGSRPDSLRDKMARFEGASHADTIELLTGLRYMEGERSHGITTGNASPTLIKGDAGIAIPVDRDPRTGEKKKKLKTSEEYVCTDCGMLLDSNHEPSLICLPYPSPPSLFRLPSSPFFLPFLLAWSVKNIVKDADKKTPGTLDSPEWRKGPNGPKTLCNACGLRWAKKEKKRNSNSNINNGSSSVHVLEHGMS
jgi:PAS domain S-box-containing protein